MRRVRLGSVAFTTVICLIGTARFAAPESAAHCIFYRERAFTGKALHASIRIDGSNVGHKLASGHMWATELVPGQHEIYSDLERYARDYQLEAGKTYYFRVEFRQNPPAVFGKLRFQVVPVETEIALREMAGMKADGQ